MSLDQVDEAGINPYSDVLDLKRYRELFGENKHPFTGVDYVDYYCELIREQGAEAEVIFANNPREIVKAHQERSYLRYPFPYAHQAHLKRSRSRESLR